MARIANGFECRQHLCGLGYLRADCDVQIRREGKAFIIEPRD
jgi:hypothetical protein